MPKPTRPRPKSPIVPGSGTSGMSLERSTVIELIYSRNWSVSVVTPCQVEPDELEGRACQVDQCERRFRIERRELDDRGRGRVVHRVSGVTVEDRSMSAIAKGDAGDLDQLAERQVQQLVQGHVVVGLAVAV